LPNQTSFVDHEKSSNYIITKQLPGHLKGRGGQGQQPQQRQKAEKGLHVHGTEGHDRNTPDFSPWSTFVTP
jgi:hypothetical protein